VKATVIKPNQAIKLRARKECVDRDGRLRVTGEEWIVKNTGAYLPGAYEEVVDVVNAFVLTEKVIWLNFLNLNRLTSVAWTTSTDRRYKLIIV
jgi:hypothetical protein